MAKEEIDRLQGMTAICEHFGRCESTLLKLIITEDFPAVKIGGIWESSKKLIEVWQQDRIESRPRRREVQD